MESTIVKLEQGSHEWRQWRHDGVGGSDVSVVIGTNPFKSYEDLIEEKAGPIQIQSAGNWDMQRGIRMEPHIRVRAEQDHQLELPPLCFQAKQYPYLRCSCDGVNLAARILLEAKSPRRIWRKVPRYYHAQVQYCMLLAGCRSALICAMTEGGRYRCWPVEADSELQDEILDAVHQFWKQVEALRRETT